MSGGDGARPGAADEVAALLGERAVVICAGSGGVGKTTTAAALALEGARRGRRTVVVTIDPAKRLADALGIGALGNDATRIEGPWPGELWAVMLDTKRTFDALVEEGAADPAQAERILGNRFYRNISGALSGTQEYMAGEKLHELHQDERFDLVVVDTPPTRRALDFLDASGRLTRFLDHRLYRLLVAPTRGAMRVVNLAAQAFLRTVSKVVGGEVLDDAIAFFIAFDGMEAGFRARAEEVQALLTDPRTAYVLVASPRAETVAEAAFFADRLDDVGVAVAALVVNRVHPRFGAGSAAADRARARTFAGSALGALYANLADLREVADAEEAHLAGLTGALGAAPLVHVPFLRGDVHDLDGLAEVADHLVGRGTNPT